MFSRGPPVRTAGFGLPPAMAACRSRCLCTRSSSSGASGVAAGAAASGAPLLDQCQGPAGQQLMSAHRSVRHSPFRL